MTLKELVKLRKQAEKAVSDMSEGELKVKAFEVVFNHLLSGAKGGAAKRGAASGSKGEQDTATADQPPLKSAASSRTAAGRILVLRDEGFFASQRMIGEVREELQAHGWHYPLTSLSGTMIDLVQRRELRRQRVKEGKKRVWKYSNP